ncbi:MAG: glycoside hydrolase family 10 protein, partial [Microcoleaceae cyanobacterium]
MKISRLLFNIILIILGFCLTIFWTIIPASKIVTANTNIQHQTSEIRGVWLTNVDSDVLFSSANTKQAVDRLASMNFNTLYPTVWQGGYTLYPSKVAEKTFGVKIDPTPGLQKRDMLEEIIKEGHAKGLKVIPWFEFGFMAPANSELARQHPDWLTKQRNGELVKMEGIEP